MHVHMHVVRVAPRPKQAPRPAKVIAIEARRQARIEARRPERQRPRPAA
jgi:hypothetical protein